MKTKRKHFFSQIENKGLITMECPDCNNYFGLNPEFIEKTADVLLQYNCPYCGSKHLIKE